MTRDFDALTCPLRGSVFIEASAGTGKTHSITSLVLRLVLEERVDLGRLLLVTYTNAATDELRRKTRERLTDALRQLEGRSEPELPRPDTLLGRLIEHERIEPETGVQRLRQALLQFDELSVLTIHGFAQRVLHDRAFESHQLFNTELEPDEFILVQKIVLDFWRTLTPRRSSRFFAYLKWRRRGLEDLLELSRGALSRVDAAILPRAESSFLGRYESALEDALDRARLFLANRREDVRDAFEGAQLDARVYHKRRVEAWLSQIEEWLQQAAPLPGECEFLDRFTNAALQGASREGTLGPSHEFFDLCDQLVELGATVEALLERQWIQTKRDLLDYLRDHLPARKRQLNRYVYDDLLQHTLQALSDESTGLSDSLAAQYPVVLIDEFQDTDPTQYGIFQLLHESPSHELLCLIGDPKQAIYAFRGGDIFTYTHARSRADHAVTLSENWRSSRALVQAVNTLYESGPRPFGTEAIRYRPVRSAEGLEEAGKARVLEGEAVEGAPLQVWQLGAERSAYLTEQRCVEAVSHEIVHLIQAGREGRLLVEGRAVQPSDIAILIRWHYQAPALQRRLQELGVRTVSYDRQHIFQTPEAADLEMLLRTLAAPRDENFLKALLLSDLVGFSGSDLEAALADDERWGRLLESMASYRAQWAAEGFIVMFRRFLREEHLPQRLLALPNGERRLTNFLQLSELTEEAQATGKLSVHATLQWYRQQRDSRLSEEKELRLESDDDRVKILTIHRSKGLEFPFVFLPFAWSGPGESRMPDHVTFHRPEDDGYVRCVDVGSKDFEANVALAREEAAEEELRMLYVALTRAVHRVYLLTVPDAARYKTSSLAYLWHHREGDSVADVPARLGRLATPRLREDYVRLVGAGGGSIGLRTWEGRGVPVTATALASVGEPGRLQARRFHGRVPRSWGITSYTGLAGHRDQTDLPDRDLEERVPGSELPAAKLTGMAALPRGTRTGNMLHLLYENLPFDAGSREIREEASRQLAVQGMPVEAWLEIVTSHTFEFLQSDLGGFALADIPAASRLVEMAFHFPISRVRGAGLRDFFVQHIPGLRANQLDAAPLEGYLKGFIDLVFVHDGKFFIADYKSNFLGPDESDYHHALLPAVMAEAGYVLQYHLYAVALHRYLKYRLGKAYDYERHFGGIYYLFVRGIRKSTSPEHGVYHDRPPLDRIEALSALLSQPIPFEPSHAS